MRYLPPIAASSDEICLPLSDHTVLRLADAILTDASDARLNLLQAAIRHDPALALWCVCFAWTRHAQSIASFDSVAQWLDLSGMAWLADAATTRVAEDRWDWAACASVSLVRRLQAEANAADNSRSSSPNALGAMLSNAAQWGSLVAGKDVDAMAQLAPPWLEAGRMIAERTIDKASDDLRLAASQTVAQWQTEHPLAWDIFKKAIALRRRVENSQRDWDEHFLREKLASLKEFTYGASHELNNPLFNISSRAQVLLRDEADPDRRRKLSTIYAHAMRASEMINDIALAARPPTPEFAEVDVVAVAREVIDELAVTADEQATTLQLTSDAPQQVIDADAVQLAVALREICINALESLERSTRRGEVTVCIDRVGAETIEIAVCDNGPGLDERARRHLFDPFFSGYESGRGLGFGLTKCWQIVQAHGGTILVDSQPQRGTSLTIRLPVTQSQSVANPGR